VAEEMVKKLEFNLDPKSGVPFYKQVILQVEMAIADGRLTKGEQLPTVRSLAVDLRINPNTVGRAYSELEIRGIVMTQQGTGTFISGKEIELDAVERERILAGITRSFFSKEFAYGFNLDEIIQYFSEIKSELSRGGEES
jgi:GntR family transcriptional regulator